MRTWLSTRNSKLILFFLIVGFAFALRLFDLDGNPAGFFRDEADKGYTTFSLIETGKDQTGDSWPIFVRSLQVTTSSLYQYIDIPFVAFFGLSETTVRLPAALAGALSCVAVFFLARLWWGTGIALWAMFFVAVSPWSLLLSRWANQSILLTLFVPLGFLFAVLAFNRGIKIYVNATLSAIFFLCSFYTYAPARLVIPVMLFLLFIFLSIYLFREKQYRARQIRGLLLFAFLFILGAIPMLQHILVETAESSARLSQISIFDGRPLGAIFTEFCYNYWLHLSPHFLFLSGDQNLRHNPAWGGQLHLYIAPLLVIGLYAAIKKRTSSDMILLIWFLAFPLAAACTRESIPHALRSVFAVPVVHLLAARGLMILWQWLQSQANIENKSWYRIGKFCTWIFVVGSLFFFFYDFYTRYPSYSALYWEDGYAEAIEWWQENRTETSETIVSGIAEYPYIFFLFYDRYDPQRWIDEQNIPGVTFLPMGQSMQPYFQWTEHKRLYLVRPFELQNIQPAKVIYTAADESIWKWVVTEQKH